MNIAAYIAKRYLFVRRNDAFKAVNYITIIASLGVALTTAALFVVLSAFSGLRTFNVSLIDRTDPDLRILPRTGKFFVLSDSVRQVIAQTSGIRTWAPVLEEKALLRVSGKQSIVLVRGVDSLYEKIVRPEEILLAGAWIDPDYDDMVVGQAMAGKLSIFVDDIDEPVYIVIPSRKRSGFFKENLVTKPFIVSGIYLLTPDTEKKYVYVSLESWRKMLQTGLQTVSFVDIELNNGSRIDRVKAELLKHLPHNLTVKDKLELNRSILKMLNLENAVTYIVGLLFLIIAVFNIVGSIIILILKKKKDRFVLSALGMDLSDVRRVFFYYGTFLILMSGTVGLVLGNLLVFLQKKFGWIYVPGTYMVYPVEFRWSNYLLVSLSLIFIAVLSSFLASRAVKEIKEKV